MRITQEADYAVRICISLDAAGKKTGGPRLAEIASVPQKFTVKILRKLTKAGILRSYKGADGGYVLARDASSITALDVIEAIDGKTLITRCLDPNCDCTRNPQKSECKMHAAFCVINQKIRRDLSVVTVAMLSDPAFTVSDVAEKIRKN